MSLYTKPQRLEEKMSFDQLFRVSDPRRVSRSFKVRGPPMDMDSYRDALYYIFNFKSNPSTTGLRHKGYVKFLRPKNPKRTPLQKLDCIVDCTCPDYRYKWAWANKQRGASRVGGGSLNQAHNRAPKITNPTGMPGLCKHILATREYIYGLLSSFSGDEPDTAYKLDKLTKYATKRWLNYNELVAQAKEREAEMQRQIAARRATGKPIPPGGIEKIKLEPPTPPEPVKPAKPATPVVPPKPFLKTGGAVPPPQKPGPAPKSTGPSSVGQQRAFLRGEQPYTKQQPGQKTPAPLPPKIAPPKPTFLRQQLPRRKKQESQITQIENLLIEGVVIPNAEFTMTTLTEAQKLVQEMEDDALAELDSPGAPPIDVGGDAPMGEPGGDGLEPSEPPISDGAIGADTEADTALGLLRQMRDLLTQLVVALAPAAPEEEGAMGGEMGAAGAMPGGEGGEFEMPPEPPTDEEVPSESGEAEGGGEKGEGGGEEEGENHQPEGGSEEEEEKEREERPNRRPSAE